MSTFRCRVVTPTEPLFEGDVSYANVPAHDGLMGFMTGRSAIVTQLGMGELKLKFADGVTRSYFIEGGFAKMADDDLIVLAERAIPAERLTEQEASAELAEAMARQPDPDVADRAEAAEAVAHEQQRARLKLKMAQHVRAHGI